MHFGDLFALTSLIVLLQMRFVGETNALFSTILLPIIPISLLSFSVILTVTSPLSDK